MQPTQKGRTVRIRHLLVALGLSGAIALLSWPQAGHADGGYGPRTPKPSHSATVKPSKSASATPTPPATATPSPTKTSTPTPTAPATTEVPTPTPSSTPPPLAATGTPIAGITAVGAGLVLLGALVQWRRHASRRKLSRSTGQQV